VREGLVLAVAFAFEELGDVDAYAGARRAEREAERGCCLPLAVTRVKMDAALHLCLSRIFRGTDHTLLPLLMGDNRLDAFFRPENRF
jgi:hypothetical protein